MRIAQITDIHIVGAGERPHDVDVREHFARVMAAVVPLHPDCVVISGDLCFRVPSVDVYQWIADQIAPVHVPVHVLAGNHDAQQLMHPYFDSTYHADTDEIYEMRLWHGIPVFFLDTARGVMSDKQYAWLAQHLRGLHGQAVIFMHHPPVFCGVPYMDNNYAFQEVARIQSVLTDTHAELQIFCGHYHVDRMIAIANQKIYITPSTFFQIDGAQMDFAIEHKNPGYRIIELHEGMIRSACFYV